MSSVIKVDRVMETFGIIYLVHTYHILYLKANSKKFCEPSDYRIETNKKLFLAFNLGGGHYSRVAIVVRAAVPRNSCFLIVFSNIHLLIIVHRSSKNNFFMVTYSLYLQVNLLSVAYTLAESYRILPKFAFLWLL